MDIVLRVLKAAVVSGIMFGSVVFLGFPISAAFALALAPLVLGMLNVLTSVAYSVTAAVFMLLVRRR